MRSTSRLEFDEADRKRLDLTSETERDEGRFTVELVIRFKGNVAGFTRLHYKKIKEKGTR